MDKEGDLMIIHHKYHLNNQLLIRGFEYKFKDFRMNKIDHQFDEKSLFVYPMMNKLKEGI